MEIGAKMQEDWRVESKEDLTHKLSTQSGLVAQRLEQQTHNLEVLGSNPSWSTKDDSVNL